MTPVNKSKDLRTTMGLFAILALAIVLRFWNLDRTSLWLDEAISWMHAKHDFIEMLRSNARDIHPPLHNIILWAQIHLFGDSETSLRFPSALMGVLGVGAIYALGRTLWGTKTGLIAAFLLALHPLLIFHAQDARMYTLLACTSTCFAWSTARYLQHATTVGAMTTCMTALTMLYTHIYGAFVFASINLFVFYILIRHGKGSRSAFGWWLLSQSLAFIGFLPWLLILARRTAEVVNSNFWIVQPNLMGLWKIANGTFSGPLLRLAFILIVIASINIVKNDRTLLPRFANWHAGQTAWGAPLLLTWLAGTIAIAFLLSILVQPILVTRYLLCIAPAFVLLVARLITAVCKFPYSSAVVCGILLIAMLPAATRSATLVQWSHNDWRTLVEIHQSHLLPDDETIFYHASGIRPYSYYGGQIRPIIEPVFIVEPESIADAMQPVDLQGRLWIIFMHANKSDQKKIVNFYASAGFKRVGEWTPHELRLLLLTRNEAEHPTHSQLDLIHIRDIGHHLHQAFE